MAVERKSLKVVVVPRAHVSSVRGMAGVWRGRAGARRPPAAPRAPRRPLAPHSRGLGLLPPDWGLRLVPETKTEHVLKLSPVFVEERLWD